jgi:3-oxoacyl-[acyl-carrier protein] reductase
MKWQEIKNIRSTSVRNADVSDIDSVNTAVEKALSQFKTIDILINNAGIAAFENS